MTCEQIAIAAMAMADGETSSITSSIIDEHLRTCANCRQELAAIADLNQTFVNQKRRQYVVDTWPVLKPQIVLRFSRWPWWLALLLAIYKLAEFVPDRGFSISVQLIPIILAAVAFALVKQNPFRIDAGLRLEQE